MRQLWIASCLAVLVIVFVWTWVKNCNYRPPLIRDLTYKIRMSSITEAELRSQLGEPDESSTCLEVFECLDKKDAGSIVVEEGSKLYGYSYSVDTFSFLTGHESVTGITYFIIPSDGIVRDTFESFK